jgi:hypothetical protein
VQQRELLVNGSNSASGWIGYWVQLRDGLKKLNVLPNISLTPEDFEDLTHNGWAAIGGEWYSSS